MAKTTIELDETLVSKALRLSKAKTKRQVIDEALRDYTQRLFQKDLIERMAAGKTRWKISEEWAAAFWEERRRGRQQAKRLGQALRKRNVTKARARQVA